MSIKAIEINKSLNKILSDKKRIINKDTLKNICRIGEGHDTCRYIMRNQDNYVCVKNSIVQVSIDETVEKDGMVARGNNCKGLINQEGPVNGKEEIHKEKDYKEESCKEKDHKEESCKEKDHKEESCKEENQEKGS